MESSLSYRNVLRQYNAREFIKKAHTLERLPNKGHGLHLSRQHFPLRAKDENSSFSESSAQVKNLVSRDRPIFAKKDFEGILEKEFDTTVPATSKDSTVEEDVIKEIKAANFSFGDPSDRSNPFVTSSSVYPSDPFAAEADSLDRKKDKVESKPWWSFITTVTPIQIFLVCSFTLIIALVFGTFSLVFRVGAIHFNE